MDYLPLFVDLRGRSCLIVGGGSVARRRAERLDEAGARLTVVAPTIEPDVATIVARRDGVLFARAFASEDVTGHALVIAATSDPKVNRAVFDACIARSIAINTVDDPSLCTVIFPAIVERDPVTVAISTGGRSPLLATIVRGWIEMRLPARLGELATWLGRWRARVRSSIAADGARRAFWRSIVEGPIAEAVYRGDAAAADRAIEERLAHRDDVASGFVSLVGAGPGDPDLLTLKALRCLAQADVVLYDNLVSPGVLALARRDARRIYVGKRAGLPEMRQGAINRLLTDEARGGRRVVRLKGGDPFIFGRGGEEIESLAQGGIACEVVPGITAALGCAAYAGIPLTHRDCAQSVRFVTGHRAGDVVNLDWPELAKPGQTLVIYMGLLGLDEICKKLIEHGRAPSTPLAMIARGTLPDQQVIVATLADAAATVRGANVRGPTTTIVGEVVARRLSFEPARPEAAR